MENKDTTKHKELLEQSEPEVSGQADVVEQTGISEQVDTVQQMFHTISWWEFLLVALSLIAIYFVLFEIQQLTKHSSFSGRYQNLFREIFRKIFVVFEGFAIVILAGVFIWINPLLHGLILGFITLGSWSYLRSYINGRWVHFDNALKEGIELRTAGLQGVVSKMGRVRLHLQTSDGVHHLSYNSLLEDGYTLVSGEEIGGFYHLELTPKEGLQNVSSHRIHLLDLFATAPYVDWHHKPEIFKDNNQENQLEARVMIKEESHLHELMALIKEWGYNCKLGAI